MPDSISTLLTRNLQDVFGENLFLFEHLCEEAASGSTIWFQFNRESQVLFSREIVSQFQIGPSIILVERVSYGRFLWLEIHGPVQQPQRGSIVSSSQDV